MMPPQEIGTGGAKNMGNHVRQDTADNSSQKKGQLRFFSVS